MVSRADSAENTTQTDHSSEEATENDHSLRADAVIVATDEATARQLLAPHVPGLAAPLLRRNSAEGGETASDQAENADSSGEMAAAPRVELVTLVIDDARLDAHPRGTGVLTVPGSHTAKALTHSTAKWPWLAEQIAHPQPSHRHVIRVSFGTAGEAPATERLSDEQAAELARTEASALLGLTLTPDSVAASHRERFTQTQPSAEIGATEKRKAARAQINTVAGLAAVGAWQAGTGLAQVIPDATEQAERIRRHVLFEPELGESKSK